MKTCKNCKITKPKTDFKKNGKTKLGTETYKPICKYCMNLMIRNSLKDTIIMIKGKPVLVPNKKRLKKNEQQKKYRENTNVHREQNRLYYHSLSPELKRKRQIKQTKLAKLRREKAMQDLIDKKRLCY